jgi:hypothetical protein
MNVFIAEMVIYPPEPPKYQRERRYVTTYQADENDAPVDCFEIKFAHHRWVSPNPIRHGARCLCGQEEFPDEN